MTTTVSDTLPLNARVRVDYSNNDVSFDYPDKTDKKSVFRFTFSQIFGMWVITHMIIIFIAIIVFGSYLMVTNPPETTLGDATPSSLTPTREDLISMGGGAGIAFYVFGVPFLITNYLVNNYDRFALSYPRFNYWFSKHVMRRREFFATVKPYDLDLEITKYGDSLYEIPIFRNIVLDYNASGEFADKLETVEIREIPYQYKIKKLFGKEEIKDYNFCWKAVFKFSGIPEDGELNIKFM